jgi:hypothetical protein
MSHMLQPPVILLREGTDTSQGIGQLVSNINACQAVAGVIRTTLGPCGMDKLIHTDGKSTISNDGAELMSLLDIVHPAAKTLADIAQSQDVQVGDGTTTVVLLAAEFLKNAKQFVEDGMHPMIIVRGYRNAMHYALKTVRELATKVGAVAREGAALWCARLNACVDACVRAEVYRCGCAVCVCAACGACATFDRAARPFPPTVANAQSSRTACVPCVRPSPSLPSRHCVAHHFFVHAAAFTPLSRWATTRRRPSWCCSGVP